MSPDTGRHRVLIAASDLHADITTLDQIRAMGRDIASRCETENLEVAALLVLGDVGETLKGIEDCLIILQDIAPFRLFIPGNHDLFDTERIGSSVRRYEALLPDVVAEAGFSWAIGAPPLMIDDTTAIVLTSAWPLPETVIAGVELSSAAVWEARHYIPDGYWITQDLKHRVISDNQLAQFEQALAALDASVKRLIVGTHYPIFGEQLESAAIHPETPWYVSPRFGRALLTFHQSRPDVAIQVISGHQHRSVSVDVQGIAVRGIKSGYHAPGYLVVRL